MGPPATGTRGPSSGPGRAVLTTGRERGYFFFLFSYFSFIRKRIFFYNQKHYKSGHEFMTAESVGFMLDRLELEIDPNKLLPSRVDISLYYRFAIHGVVSFSSSAGCVGNPKGYVEVHRHLNFIKKFTKQK